MAVRTSNAGGDFDLCPPGMHVAILCKVIDIGTHVDPNFKKAKRLGYLAWELPNLMLPETKEHGARPRLIYKRYTLSHNEKAILRLDIESWYGQSFSTKDLDDADGFDLDALLGRPCILNVVHSEDKKYANIATVNPMIAGLECPAPYYTPFSFGLDPFDAALFGELSENMQNKVKESEEYKALKNGAAPGQQSTGSSAPAPKQDLPFGKRQAAPGKPKGGGTGFDDMEDDIPFVTASFSADPIMRKFRRAER